MTDRVQGAGLRGIELGASEQRKPRINGDKIDTGSLLQQAAIGILEEYDRRADELIATKTDAPADFTQKQKEKNWDWLLYELGKAMSEAQDQGLMALPWFNARAEELLDEALRSLDHDLQELWAPPEL